MVKWLKKLKVGEISNLLKQNLCKLSELNIWVLQSESRNKQDNIEDLITKHFHCFSKYMKYRRELIYFLVVQNIYL